MKELLQTMVQVLTACWQVVRKARQGTVGLAGGRANTEVTISLFIYLLYFIPAWERVWAAKP
ncbi:hypothetical protein E2C01_048401 [Portunus trituberculatus]|uniref:Uncharacterized protein n=1 Tax=Portunus trituberculatus TaxID=210409 RepID=A0A5B7GB19_PORTR|nr:hypothetical protein [Portunus trituberculatus]